MRARTARALLTSSLLLIAWRAEAQFTQYSAPGSPNDHTSPKQEAVEKEVDSARYRLGPVHISPALGLRDLSYISNPLATSPSSPADFTGTVGGGLRAYLRTGRRVIWTAHALPEYVWWRHLTDRRRLNQRYGASVFAFFHRLDLEASAARDEEQAIATAELLSPVNLRTDRGAFAAEFRAAGPFSLFATGSVTRFTSLIGPGDVTEALALDQLDRDERVGRAGVRVRAAGGWIFGLGAEHSDVTFRGSLLDRSNAGTSPVAEVQLERPRLTVHADVAARSLDPAHGASFVPYRRVTGNLLATVRLTPRFDVQVYGGRNLVYSLLVDYAYLTDDRAGAALEYKLGRRISTRVFAEAGRDDYTALAAGTPRRLDDATSYGAALHVDFGSASGFTLQGVDSRYVSNLPGFDRSYRSVAATLNLTGNFDAPPAP